MALVTNERQPENINEKIDTPVQSGIADNENSIPSRSAKFLVQQDILKIGYLDLQPVTFNIYQDLKDVTNANIEFIIDTPESKNLYSPQIHVVCNKKLPEQLGECLRLRRVKKRSPDR